jgi:hypothetical protein
MAEQKKEAREGLQDEMVAIHILIKWKCSPAEVKAFRDKTRPTTTGGRAKLGWFVARRPLWRGRNKH